jgi:[ribosomal protein S5]-alanine N-acetyltransferase
MAGGRDPRVALRELSPRDCQDFIAGMRASRALHRPWVVGPCTPEQFQVFLERSGGEASRSLVLRRLEDERLVGYFKLGEIVRGDFQNAYLGYAAVAPHQRRGYMTEGLRLLLRLAFSEMGLHRIEANIQAENVRSLALVRRCGFVKEGFSERYLKIGGRWCDHERWAIRSEQHRALRPQAGP